MLSSILSLFRTAYPTWFAHPQLTKPTDAVILTVVDALFDADHVHKWKPPPRFSPNIKGITFDEDPLSSSTSTSSSSYDKHHYDKGGDGGSGDEHKDECKEEDNGRGCGGGGVDHRLSERVADEIECMKNMRGLFHTTSRIVKSIFPVPHAQGARMIRTREINKKAAKARENANNQVTCPTDFDAPVTETASTRNISTQHRDLVWPCSSSAAAPAAAGAGAGTGTGTGTGLFGRNSMKASDVIRTFQSPENSSILTPRVDRNNAYYHILSEYHNSRAHYAPHSISLSPVPSSSSSSSSSSSLAPRPIKFKGKEHEPGSAPLESHHYHHHHHHHHHHRDTVQDIESRLREGGEQIISGNSLSVPSSLSPSSSASPSSLSSSALASSLSGNSSGEASECGVMSSEARTALFLLALDRFALRSHKVYSSFDIKKALQERNKGY